MNSLDCPDCGRRLISRQPDVAKLRTPVLLLHKSGEVGVVCRYCRSEVALGVHLGAELAAEVFPLSTAPRQPVLLRRLTGKEDNQ